MTRLAVALLALLGVACSDAPDVPPGDGGTEEMGVVTPDSSSPMPDAGDRLLPHEGVIVANLQLGVVYVGDVDAGGAPIDDPDLDWLLGSFYWRYLTEYGVGNGAVAGSARVSQDTFFQAGDVDGATGLVDILVLQERIAEALHGDADAGSGTGTVSIPGAQGYLVFLPDGVNVALGHRGTYTYQTCVDADGYHAYDGVEPYAVLPPCAAGRTLYAASHELAELATDPQPYDGWASDTDVPINGGEVADLCAEQVMQEGMWVTRLWSNESGGCVP